MTHVRFDCIVWQDSGLPEDYTMNTWHIDTTGAALAGAVAFQSDVTQFYLAIDSYLASTCEGTIAFRAYDMSEPTPRVPILIDGMAATPGTGTLPQEVALCSSFQGDRVSGIPQSRRRGRVYIGPLAVAALNDAAGRPASAFVTALADATEALLLASIADGAYDWVVYSPTDDALVPIDNGWVDNAFDTQRRRGVAASGRTSWP